MATSHIPVAILKENTTTKPLTSRADLYSDNANYSIVVGCIYVSDTTLKVHTSVNGWSLGSFDIYGVK